MASLNKYKKMPKFIFVMLIFVVVIILIGKILISPKFIDIFLTNKIIL